VLTSVCAQTLGLDPTLGFAYITDITGSTVTIQYPKQIMGALIGTGVTFTSNVASGSDHVVPARRRSDNRQDIQRLLNRDSCSADYNVDRRGCHPDNVARDRRDGHIRAHRWSVRHKSDRLPAGRRRDNFSRLVEHIRDDQLSEPDWSGDSERRPMSPSTRTTLVSARR
jgi:hypothetical protein